MQMADAEACDIDCDVFNDYVDAHTRDASSSESDVDDVSEDDDDSDAIGSADVQLLTCHLYCVVNKHEAVFRIHCLVMACSLSLKDPKCLHLHLNQHCYPPSTTTFTMVIIVVIIISYAYVVHIFTTIIIDIVIVNVFFVCIYTTD